MGPGTASAQDEAGIAGTVTDESGAVMPGVTVVAASPALIEQSRTVFTDGTGNYRFTTLPAGTYSVTFTLQGFRTFVREGVVLQGAFVANVDAEMAVGTVAETVTVTGASPIVDVVSTRRQMVMPAEQVNALPASTNIHNAMQYVPGVNARENFLASHASIEERGPTIHGSVGADSQPHVDGINSGTQLNSRNQSVGGIGTVEDEAAIAEMVYDTGSGGAEFAQSGVRTNVIPKAGANTFSGELFLDGGHENFADSNLTPELEGQGFAFAPTAWSWDINPAFGGPIVKDKLWFFGSYVKARNKTFLTDIFWNPDEPSTPDGIGDDLRAFNKGNQSVQNIRITYQINNVQKVMSSFTSHQNNFSGVVGTGFGRVAPEALFGGNADPTFLSTTRWTAPFTDRLLVEATFAYQRMDLQFTDWEENGIGRVAFNDLATGLQSGTSILQDFLSEDHRRQFNASISYVTGSHNFKAGIQYGNNVGYAHWQNNGDILQAIVTNGFPIGIVAMGPGDAFDERKQNCECGIYAQDAWTMDRLTVNVGVRFDWLRGSIPEQPIPAGFWTPARTQSAINDIPSWNDWNGRFGAAYDLTGDGRTAVKGFAGRYVSNEGLGITDSFSPIGFETDFRFWHDSPFFPHFTGLIPPGNGDGTVINPDGTPQFSEVGPSFNPNFGTDFVTNRLDPDARRLSNWEYNAGIEHQLNDQWSISGMWHHRRYGNFRWFDNTALSASDFTSVAVQGPSDPSLPGGASQTMTIYEFADPNFVFRSGDILVTAAEDDSRTWNGFEVILDGRLWFDGFGTASWTIGNETNKFCTEGQLENPNDLRFCENSSGYRNSFKFSGSIPLPYDIMISGLFQIFAGNEILANYNVNVADLGRPVNINLGSAATTGNVDFALIEPGTEYEDLTTQLDLRFQKIFTVPGGNMRIRAFMDAANLFNTLTIFTRNQFWGGGQLSSSDYFRPIAINNGRVLSFGAQVSF